MDDEKPFCLILLDLIFWVMPEAEIFGETVRDLLCCERFITLNIYLQKASPRLFAKKMKKLRDSLEIHGYILKVDTTQHYNQSWEKFESTFNRNKISTAVVQKIGDHTKQIRLLLISQEKFSQYHPLFKCNMLRMSSGGDLSLLNVNLLMMEYQTTSSKMSFLQEVLDDIYSRKVTPIRPVKIGNGYEDRLKRSEIIFMLVELMEKGWEPTFSIEECGFNLSINNLKVDKDISFAYPKMRRIYKRMILNDLQWLNKNSELDISIKADKVSKSKDICPICHDLLSDQSTLKLNCNHIFHNFCIYQHFHKIGSNSDLCPICRSPVVRESGDSTSNITIVNYESETEDTTELDTTSSETSETDEVDVVQENSIADPPPISSIANEQLVVAVDNLERVLNEYDE